MRKRLHEAEKTIRGLEERERELLAFIEKIWGYTLDSIEYLDWDEYYSLRESCAGEPAEVVGAARILRDLLPSVHRGTKLPQRTKVEISEDDGWFVITVDGLSTYKCWGPDRLAVALSSTLLGIPRAVVRVECHLPGLLDGEPEGPWMELAQIIDEGHHELVLDDS